MTLTRTGAAWPVTVDHRPTVAGLPPAVQGPAEREPVSGHHLDRAREIGKGQVVEEPALRQARIGQEVAVSLGLAPEHVGEIGAGEQPGHPDVAAEEVVDHRHQSDVVAVQ